MAVEKNKTALPGKSSRNQSSDMGRSLYKQEVMAV